MFVQQLVHKRVEEALKKSAFLPKSEPVIADHIRVDAGDHLRFSDYELTKAKKQTKPVNCLSEMQTVLHWRALIMLIKSYDPKTRKKADWRQVHPSRHWTSSTLPRTAAVELRRIELPRCTGCHSLVMNNCSSASLHPPSGPTSNQTMPLQFVV